MGKLISRTVAGAAFVGLLLVGPATQVAADNGDSLAAVRAATAKFHSIPAAEAAGYARPAALPCFDRPGVGGMGLHWVNGSLFTATPTATKPQAMVYEVDGDELTLVAVEYLIPFTLVPGNAQAPTLLGQHFHHAFLPNGQPLGLWALHAWIWESNPLGMFADYNPEVELCPGTRSLD